MKHLLPGLFCFALLSASAEEKKAGAVSPGATDFIRFVETDEGDSLQTAVVSYESPAGVIVDLVGAVHIADKKYFEALNKRFKGYEVVLYELVGRPVEERETLKVADGEKKLQWLGTLQEKMRSTLKLESQLQCIDYRAKNFVHADLTTDGFFEKQEEKKENFLSLWMKAALAQAATADPNKANSDMALIMTMLMSKDSSTDLKRLLGSEFDRVENLMAGVEAGNGTAIIGERNKHALEVMEKQVAAGKKRIAIFYGAAHFPDMEQRLLKMGYKLRKTEWEKAWDIDA
ncbi:hypothetical protein [Brevifollis gellanilyticus]|uniref:TraB/GumN family protein n=1 Tax=Brevifollis gellanilyticus TaxID=748831 RepID=A0A512M8P6_9BACT|nr:hypothetical protein [Brevifollis gellanilyticus]GEP43120.1 hypothetical protein BGE01nite_24110 [Brevifollis gellanilyticus]